MTDYHPLRLRLLELHKSLIAEERALYESKHGRVSPTAFWQALTSDPSLTWLAPLNAAIVQLDELLDLHAAGNDNAEGLADQLSSLRTLLTLGERTDPFGLRYGELIDASPEVAFAHGALWNVLRG